MSPDPPNPIASRHPCWSQDPRTRNGRIHLPVAPACNLQCRFCLRVFNAGEERPGVSRGILPVAEVPAVIERALALCPEITVAGIAGPGDTLASPHALEAFSLVQRHFPGLITCLSTNGLLLQQRLPELLAAGVGTVTVTVNGVRPETVGAVVASIRLGGVRFSGPEGARLLVQRQLAGIRAAVAAGIPVKVNMVLIPGVNDQEVDATARAVAQAGASLINLLPLLPQGGFAHLAPPTCAGLHGARQAARRHLPVFQHCQHCRADAVGIPGGTDFAGTLYGGLDSPGETFSHG